VTGTLTPPPSPPLAPPATSPVGRDQKPWYKREFYIGRAVKAEEVMNFSRQAASFLRAGIPILDALAIVGEETGSKKMMEVLDEVRRRVRGGQSLGDAIASHPKVFPGYYIAMVRSAELTGQLDEVLDQLAGYLERDIAARRQVKSALTYPMIVLVLALVAVVVMAAFILPKFKSLYSELDADLPLPTRILLGFTDFMTNWWFVILAVLGVVLLITFLIVGGKQGKGRRDRLAMHLPGVGKLLHLVAVERFCRVLAALVSAGVSLPEAVTVSANSTNNAVFQEKLATARDAMVRGEGLAGPIAATQIFPAAARQMIRVGESTGTLDQQLHTAALFYERELTYRLKKATDTFEPAVILTVGCVVGFVAVAQVSAMYSVFNQVNP
jgi:type IV pilus assembly protein PilC